jgi:hypothetical protein
MTISRVFQNNNGILPASGGELNPKEINKNVPEICRFL